MKKTKISLMAISALLTLIAVFATSCEKEELTEPKEKSVENTVQKLNYSFPKIYCEDGRLVFETLEDVKTTILKLENDYYNHLNGLSDFIIENKLSQEQIEGYTKSNNWNNNLTLENFENQFDYISLRSVIEKKKIDFLKNNLPEEKLNPDNHFVADEFIRTILNHNCEVKIGDDIYKVFSNGLTVAILKSNKKVLNSINEDNIFDFKLNKEIYVYGEYQDKSSTCKGNYSSDWFGEDYNYDGKSRKMNCKIIVNNYPWIHNLKMKTEMYSYKWSKWRKWYAPEVRGGTKYSTIRSSDCNSILSTTGWTGHVNKYTWKNEYKYNVGSVTWFKVKSGDVKGYFDATGYSGTFYMNLYF